MINSLHHSTATGCDLHLISHGMFLPATKKLHKMLHCIKHFSLYLTCSLIRQNFVASFGHQSAGRSRTATQRVPMHHVPAEVKAQFSISLHPRNSEHIKCECKHHSTYMMA
jgi:hypothetical protein